MGCRRDARAGGLLERAFLKRGVEKGLGGEGGWRGGGGGEREGERWWIRGVGGDEGGRRGGGRRHKDFLEPE